MSAGRISLDTVLAACDDAGAAHEPVTASEIAEELGCTRRTAYNKLDELAERGDVRSKKIGARARVWWRPADDSATDRTSARSRDCSAGVSDPASGSPERERELSRLIDDLPGMVYRCRNERGWPIEFVSEACRDLTGYDPDSLERDDVRWGEDVIVEGDREMVWEEIQTAVADREPFSITYRIETADGELRWVRSYGRGIFDDDGVVLEGIISDVTERKRLEADLAESEHRYRALVENFPNGAVALVDDDLRYRTVGGSPLDSTAEELEGSPVREVLPPAVADALVPGYEAALEGEFSEFEAQYGGRTYKLHIAPVRDGDGDIFAALGMSQDITDHKENQRELERALDLLDRTERIADVGGWEIDARTQDVFWTDHIFELLDVNADEEPPLEEALDMYHEADQPIVEDAVENALDTGEPFDVEVRIQTDSGELRWLRLQGVPETDDDGVVSFRGAAQDVTDRVERERQLEETVEKLEESNAHLESFASMLAHELRNPITIGQIYSQELPTETGSEAVEYVTEAFDRIEAMVDVMLMLTRGREAIGEQTPVRLADVARNAWNGVDAPDATLEVDIDDTIRADEAYIRHLFRNLFENAVEHGGRDVTITVGDLPTGFYVADDGHGIPVEDRAAVFDPGFTTAAEQGGTGLGLAFVEKLAGVYGWESTVTESTAGGARFEFTNVDRNSPRD